MNRRHSLALVAGAVTSLAGCSGIASNSGRASSDSPGGEATVTDGPSSGTTTDPETVLIRAHMDRPPVWLNEPGSDDSGRPTPRPDGHHIESIVLDSEARADRLSVDADVDSTRVTSFLQATDFEAETVFVETIRVEECFRLDLCRISWQPEKVSTDYTRRNRPWDEQCAVDEQVYEVRIIRISDAIDSDDVSAGSTSIGTGGCHDTGRARAIEESGSGTSTPDDTGSETPTGTNITARGDQ
ncbi:hypothetical protein VB773_20985 [Haloarculaceae archaeon H-GB2-1]|nr:hypothetical protein [Haloarculaceae archaeon H-GB1-1]MEA5389403.1 hypothetical protein [Haloarculaceae archaeon H-GB11]MEA5409798.1 hypothetical protein [Haloarculaceae archaeon H-GB2-1]